MRKFVSHFPILLFLASATFDATGADAAAMFCHQAHSTVLSSEQISSRINALIAEQIRVQQYNFSDPALFNQSRAYVEKEKSRLAQVVPDFESVYRDRYLALRDELKKNYKTQRSQAKAEEQKRQNIIHKTRLPEPHEAFRIPHEASAKNPHFVNEGRQIFTVFQLVAGDFIRVTDASSGQVLHTLEHKFNMEKAHFSEDGKTYVRHAGSSVFVGDTFSNQAPRQIPHPKDITESRLTPDGKFVIARCKGDIVQISDVSSGEALYKFEKSKWYIKAGFDADGNILIYSYEDKKLQIINPASGQSVGSFPHLTTYVSTALSPDRKFFFVAATSDERKIIDVASGLSKNLLADSILMSQSDFSPDQQIVATTLGPSTLQIIEASSGQVLKQIEKFGIAANSPIFSPDGKFLVALHGERAFSIVEIASHQVFEFDFEHEGRVTEIKISPDSNSVIATVGNNAVVISLYRELGNRAD